MQRTLILLLALALHTEAAACPEIVVPLDPSDPAFKSTAWRGALRFYRDRHHDRALKAFRKTNASLLEESERLFHPEEGKEPAKNSAIQKWLERHVYHKHPGVLVASDRFTYPAIVWWAWADTACRAGDYAEAHTSLVQLRAVRPGPDSLDHEILLLVRTGRVAEAQAKLRDAVPDGFFTPYVNGLIARAEGKEGWRELLAEAKRASALDDQREAVDRELRR